MTNLQILYPFFFYKLSFPYFSLNALAYLSISFWCVVCFLFFAMIV